MCTGLIVTGAACAQDRDAMLPALPLQDSTHGASSRMGSGVIVNPDGHVVTAYHVVDGCPIVRIAYHRGKQTYGHVVATDPNNDLALLASDIAAEFVPAFRAYPPVQRAHKVVFPGLTSEGEWVPSPVMLKRAAILRASGPQRDTRLLTLWTRAFGMGSRVEGGDSGGPIFDERGNIVGMVTGVAAYASSAAPQSTMPDISFGLNSAMVLLFLGSHNIDAKVVAGKNVPALGDSKLRELSSKAAVRIWCDSVHRATF